MSNSSMSLWLKFLGACVLALFIGQAIELTALRLLVDMPGEDLVLRVAGYAGIAVVIMLYALAVFAVVLGVARMLNRPMRHPQIWVILSAILGRYLAVIGLPNLADGLDTSDALALLSAFGNVAFTHVLTVYLLPAVLIFHILRGAPGKGLAGSRLALIALILGTVALWELISWGGLMA